MATPKKKAGRTPKAGAMQPPSFPSAKTKIRGATRTVRTGTLPSGQGYTSTRIKPDSGGKAIKSTMIERGGPTSTGKFRSVEKLTDARGSRKYAVRGTTFRKIKKA